MKIKIITKCKIIKLETFKKNQIKKSNLFCLKANKIYFKINNNYKYKKYFKISNNKIYIIMQGI